jgi:hypothetical protein
MNFGSTNMEDTICISNIIMYSRLKKYIFVDLYDTYSNIPNFNPIINNSSFHISTPMISPKVYMTTIYKFCSYCSFQISTLDISYDIDLHILLIFNIPDFDPWYLVMTSVISWWSVLLVEQTGRSGENQRPVASHRQTLSHNMVSSTLHHERDSNS